MNFKEEFNKCNEQLQKLRMQIAGKNDFERQRILLEMAHNNGKLVILREVIR